MTLRVDPDSPKLPKTNWQARFEHERYWREMFSDVLEDLLSYLKSDPPDVQFCREIIEARISPEARATYRAGDRKAARQERPKPKPPAYRHGSKLGSEHTSLRRHLIEDHPAIDPDVVHEMSDGGVHGYHDGAHNRTWAYSEDLSHEPDKLVKMAADRPDHSACGWAHGPGDKCPWVKRDE